MTSARANRRGMFALMGAMAAFAVNDMMLKLTAQRYPLGEVITVRGMIATVLVGAFLVGFGHVCALRAAFSPIVLGRTALDGLAMVLFTTALIHMPLAELSAINLVSPLIITALAVIFFARRGRLAALDRDRRRLRRHAVHRQADPRRLQRLGAARHCAARSRASSRDMITRQLDPAHSERS